MEHGTKLMVRQQETPKFSFAEYSYLSKHMRTIKCQNSADCHFEKSCKTVRCNNQTNKYNSICFTYKG